MRRLIGIIVVLVASLAAYAGTMATGAQQAPTLTCSPTSVPSTGPSVTFTCSIENFPPNTQVMVTEALVPRPLQVTTTDDAGRASFRFLIHEAGVCAQRSDGLAAASGGDAEASTAFVVTPVPLPPLFAAPLVPCRRSHVKLGRSFWSHVRGTAARFSTHSYNEAPGPTPTVD
jgi:hypothetical protein